MIDPPIHPSYNATVEVPRKKPDELRELADWFIRQWDGNPSLALYHACATLLAFTPHIPRGLLRLPLNHAVKPAKVQPKTVD